MSDGLPCFGIDSDEPLKEFCIRCGKPMLMTVHRHPPVTEWRCVGCGVQLVQDVEFA